MHHQSYLQSAKFTQLLVDVSQGQERNIENSVTITNAQILDGAKRAYEDGKITETEYNTIRSGLSQRIGVKGETKIVQVDSKTIDIYLDNVLAGMLLGAGAGAVVISLMKIPGIASLLKNMGIGGDILKLALGGAGANLLDTSNGIIVRLNKIPDKPMPGGYTEPGWVGGGARDQ